MRFSDYIKNVDDPLLRKRLNSYQFQISNQILGKRISLNLTQKETAKRLHLTLNQYKAYEDGINMSASKSEYLHILHQLNQIQAKSSKRKGISDN